MNLYATLGSGIGSNEAAALSARLAAWHDAMVAHERRLRTDPAAARCDDECPHADAVTLWLEAVEVFGRRAYELAFLRSRANGAGDRPAPARGDALLRPRTGFRRCVTRRSASFFVKRLEEKEHHDVTGDDRDKCSIGTASGDSLHARGRG